MLARPRSIASEFTSRKMTETPRELSHCAMPEPITPAPMTAACVNFSPARLGRAFAVFVREEKIADQIAGRFGFAQLDDRVELQRERFVDRSSSGFG